MDHQQNRGIPPSPINPPPQNRGIPPRGIPPQQNRGILPRGVLPPANRFIQIGQNLRQVPYVRRGPGPIISHVRSLNGHFPVVDITDDSEPELREEIQEGEGGRIQPPVIPPPPSVEDELRWEIARRDSRIRQLRTQLDQVSEERDHFRDRCQSAERELNACQPRKERNGHERRRSERVRAKTAAAGSSRSRGGRKK